MVVNLYLLIHDRIPNKLVDLHGKSMNIFHVLLRFHTSQLMRAGFLNDQVGSIFMFGFSPLRGEDAAERDKMRQKKAVPKWCVLCLQLELLVQWWSWWDLQSNRRSCRGRFPSISSSACLSFHLVQKTGPIPNLPPHGSSMHDLPLPFVMPFNWVKCLLKTAQR